MARNRRVSVRGAVSIRPRRRRATASNPSPEVQDGDLQDDSVRRDVPLRPPVPFPPRTLSPRQVPAISSQLITGRSE